MEFAQYVKEKNSFKSFIEFSPNSDDAIYQKLPKIRSKTATKDNKTQASLPSRD